MRTATGAPHPTTPDGRYFVVRNRLWRCTNPTLGEQERLELTHALMSARRAKQAAMRMEDWTAADRARYNVNEAKRALGERGPVWWTDGAPDFNRKMVRNTPYAAWFETLPPG